MASEIKKLAEEIREINTANGWNVWQPSDINTEVNESIDILINDLTEEILKNSKDEFQTPNSIYEIGADKKILNELIRLSNMPNYKFPAIIALIQSEASEALEWYRQINKTGYIINDKIMTLDDLNNFLGTENFGAKNMEIIRSKDDVLEKIKEEMADIIIRCLDWWSAYDDDPMDTIKAKLDKNRKRGNRHGGKTI